MKIIAERRQWGLSWWLWLVGIVFHLAAFAADSATNPIPVVRTSKAVYTNVVLISRTATDLFIRHGDGNMANIKIEAIDNDEALIALGLKSAEQIALDKQSVMDRFLGSTNETMRVIMDNPALTTFKSSINEVKWTAQSLAIIGGVFLVFYLFGCYCMNLICVKAGHNPGALIWVPVFHWISMFQAAGMSGWWMLALFVPLLNLVALIIWCFKIVQRRHKGVVWAILLLFPVTNLIAFLYLAFSNGEDQGGKPTPRSEPKSGKMKLGI